MSHMSLSHMSVSGIMLSPAEVHVQPMDCKALAQGQEPLLKIALIQLPDQGSILSVTLAHCLAGKLLTACELPSY